jgi:FhuF 2Fe-2S C-terminal domain
VTPTSARPATAKQVSAALRTAAELGPFFRLELPRTSAGWQPADAFYRDGLTALVASTARRLATSESRVAASSVHLSLAARLWSPVLASALLAGVIPDLRALTIRVDPIQVALTSPSGWLVTSPDQSAGLTAVAVGPQLAALAAGLRPRLAAGLLRGNSASAVVAALRLLATAHPELVAEATSLARALLQAPGLRGGGTLADAGAAEPAVPEFQRRSCCLYYRVPGGGLCADCCLSELPSAPAR